MSDATTDYNAIYASLNSYWRQLCKTYLPLTADGSIWRYSRQPTAEDPEQGWKLHVAATILSAADVFEAVGPFLRSKGALFKAPFSLYELHKLNSGQLYGYSQVGKFITIYPQNEAQAVLFARQLYKLTRNLAAPSIPFDVRYRHDGCVFYRYGAFKHLNLDDPHGDTVFAVRSPSGELVRDDRHSISSPTWASNPFNQKKPGYIDASLKTPLQTTFKVFEAVSQRGRGGVYRALDLGVYPPRFCILKEGRKHGEVDWDGRDGVWRVRHEKTVLAALRKAAVDVPEVYGSFELEGNSYVAMELIEGENLNRYLSKRRRRLSVRKVLQYSLRIARLVARLHSANWVWRDCKPGNIIITKDGRVRAVDFEGACPIDEPDPCPWGTRFFVPPEWDHEFRGQSRLPEDLFALGAIIELLLTGAPPDDARGSPATTKKKRRKVPVMLQKIIESLLFPDPEKRPQAYVVARRLETLLQTLNSTPRYKYAFNPMRRARSANLKSLRRSA